MNCKIFDYKKIVIDIPNLPGVYIMRDEIGDIIYIGKAKNLKVRILSYLNNNLSLKTTSLITTVKKIDYILCVSERESLILERELINKVKPYFNFVWKDDKSYPYIKFSKNEDFPRLILTRKKTNDGALYFGPYHKVFYVKKFVRWLVNFFKIRKCNINIVDKLLLDKIENNLCIYYQTGMCYGPCGGKITSKHYKSKVKNVIFFLNGKIKKFEKKINVYMKYLNKNMEYEKMKEIRDMIYAFKSMSEKIIISKIDKIDINQFIKNTNAISELKNILNLKLEPTIIEGFDISNTCGENSVASMVRFQNGIADKKQYRRFKIKFIGINDVASIAEVIFRRYSYLIKKKEKLPNLILIDGGKGQLLYAINSLISIGIKIPIIAIAKKKEKIFLQNIDKEIILSKNSEALKLLQLIRDEAHRFATNYHKKLRWKKIFI
jgi:excinuclease ABC subunit C